jgi:hypothetical protein
MSERTNCGCVLNILGLKSAPIQFEDIIANSRVNTKCRLNAHKATIVLKAKLVDAFDI